MTPPRSSSSVQPIYRGAIRLAGQLLQFDGFTEAGVTFVSHAHVTVPPGAGQIITSDLTAPFLGAHARHVLSTPFNRRFSLGELELRLLPTGHIPGAAALEVRYRKASLTYAGQIGGRSDPYGFGVATPHRCDALVLAATYGHPRYAFPEASELLARVFDFCRETLAAGATPVLLCRPLGKAQGLTALLDGEGFGVRLHKSMYRYLAPLRQLGISVGPARRFSGRAPGDTVLLWPHHLARSPSLEGLGPLRRALLSGRAVEPEVVRRLRVDEAFPLSDLADFERTVEFVARSTPGRVHLIHGPQPALEDALQRRGLDVRPLGPPAQLQLFGG